MEQESVKVPTYPIMGPGLTDIPDLLDGSSVWEDRNVKLDVLLRNAMASTSPADFQPLLWQGRKPNCTLSSGIDDSQALECSAGGTTFQNISTLQNPFIAQLPSQYHAGLIRQFAPRINASVSLKDIYQSDFPRECAQIRGAYYKEYISQLAYGSTLSIQICMPGNVSYSSPWKPVRDRQNISEQLFLNISWPKKYTDLVMLQATTITSSLIVNSTMGFFELPNYDNGGIAGNLLAQDPAQLCNSTEKCLNQELPWIPELGESRSISQPTEIFQVAGRGSLAMIVMALFDEGSYVDQTLSQRNNTPKNNGSQQLSRYSKCSGFIPLASLFDETPASHQPERNGGTCADTQPTVSFEALSTWLTNFQGSHSSENALHAAILLASQIWLTNLPGLGGSLLLHYDLGQDTTRPKISKTGVYLISVFLCLDLLLLLILAAYVYFSQTWISSLDAITMMKLGAARADDLPLEIETSSEKVAEVLERIPGWVGDARPEESVGLLALGAATSLKAGREYVYSPSNASLRTQSKISHKAIL